MCGQSVTVTRHLRESINLLQSKWSVTPKRLTPSSSFNPSTQMAQRNTSSQQLAKEKGKRKKENYYYFIICYAKKTTTTNTTKKQILLCKLLFNNDNNMQYDDDEMHHHMKKIIIIYETIMNSVYHASCSVILYDARMINLSTMSLLSLLWRPDRFIDFWRQNPKQSHRKPI